MTTRRHAALPYVLAKDDVYLAPTSAFLDRARGRADCIEHNSRPQRGGRGDYRVAMRHGVSRVRRGHRHTLGIIFHDAA